MALKRSTLMRSHTLFIYSIAEVWASLSLNYWENHGFRNLLYWRFLKNDCSKNLIIILKILKRKDDQTFKMILHTLLLNWLSSFSLVVSSSLLAANNLLLLNSKAFRSSFSFANLSLAVSASFAKRLALKEEEENVDYHI